MLFPNVILRSNNEIAKSQQNQQSVLKVHNALKICQKHEKQKHDFKNKKSLQQFIQTYNDPRG